MSERYDGIDSKHKMRDTSSKIQGEINRLNKPECKIQDVKSGLQEAKNRIQDTKYEL